MELALQAPTRRQAESRSISRHVDVLAVSAWALPFVLVCYLALRDGGYDGIVRGQVGIAVWWVVLLGAVCGLLPGKVGPAGWVALGLLAAFTAWTGIAAGWSENVEGTVAELGRLVAYLGVLVLVIVIQGRAAARHTLGGLTAAIGLVTVLAVLSRLHPQAFPNEQHFQFLGPGSSRKLSYPLNYWNALADFAAMGVPLLVVAAVGARHMAFRALAAATLPLSALCVYLTISRGGAIALGLAIVAVVVLIPRRLEVFATLIVGAAGAAILLRAASHHPAVTTGGPLSAEIQQGTGLLWLTLVVCVGVGSLQIAISLAAEHLERPRLLRPTRRAFATRVAVAAAALLLVAVAAGVPGKLSHAWHDFKQPSGLVVPTTDTNIFSRLQAANGNSRYQFWQSAVAAYKTDPCCGIGPGTFQFWWARHATASGFIRNAHSLYFETLAETGIFGLVLLTGLFIWFLAVGAGRALRDPPELRLWLAGATASMVVFMFAAAVEWVWQLAAVATAALIAGGVIVAGRGDHADVDLPSASLRRFIAPGTLVLISLAAIGTILVPLTEQLAIRQSQAAAATGRLSTAFQDSLTAQRLEPYAAGPRLQQALVLEAAGDLGPASAAAEAATARGSTDWTAWLTLARIDARRGDARAAIAALDRAHALNPRSALFRQP